MHDGSFRFVLTDFSKASLQADPPPAGEYVIASVTVSNTGTEARSLLANNQKLIDTAGHEHAPLRMQALSADHDTTILELAPGAEKKVVIRFDVPKDVKLSAIELHDAATSAGATVRLPDYSAPK